LKIISEKEFIIVNKHNKTDKSNQFIKKTNIILQNEKYKVALLCWKLSNLI